MHREILEIYERASSQTKHIYDLGHDRDGVEVENWIVGLQHWRGLCATDQLPDQVASMACFPVSRPTKQ